MDEGLDATCPACGLPGLLPDELTTGAIVREQVHEVWTWVGAVERVEQ